MRLLALAASVALSAMPLNGMADETNSGSSTNTEPVVSTVPVAGGVATSSFDFEIDADLVAFLISAGGSAVIGGVAFALVQGDDGTFTVSTSTTTN